MSVDRVCVKYRYLVRIVNLEKFRCFDYFCIQWTTPLSYVMKFWHKLIAFRKHRFSFLQGFELYHFIKNVKKLLKRRSEAILLSKEVLFYGEKKIARIYRYMSCVQDSNFDFFNNILYRYVGLSGRWYKLQVGCTGNVCILFVKLMAL